MNIIGADYFRSMLEADGYFLKLLLNDSAAYFFPYTMEHREATQAGLRYQDDSLGNALAATIKPKQVDIRLHAAFSYQRVIKIMSRLIQVPGLWPLAEFSVFYYGRKLELSQWSEASAMSCVACDA